MATEQELLDAFDKADAAGNTDDAQFFADEIKSLRGGGQSTPGVVPLDAETGPDTDDNDAPHSIGDVQLTPEMRQWWKEGSALEPGSDERGLLEAKFAGRIESMGRGGGLGDMAVNAFTSFFDTPVNIGTAIGGAINPNMTAKQSLTMQREFRKAQGEKFGKSQFVSTLAGDVGTGVLIAKKGIEGATKLVGKEIAEKASVFSAQKGFKNAATRMAGFSVVGAAEGAIVEGMRRGEAITGATLGLLAGPLGEALPLLKKVVEATTPGVIKAMVRSPETKALRLLADKVKVPHDEMMKRFNRFTSVFGRPPSMAELGDSEFNTELLEIVNDSVKSSVLAREGVLDLQARSARETSEAVTRGVTPATTVGQTAAQKKVADDAFKKVRGEIFEFEGDDVKRFLEDDDIMNLIPKEARKGIREQIVAATDDTGDLIGSVTLDGAFVDDLRLALGAAAKGGKGFPRKFLEAQEDLMGLAGEQSDTLSKAVGQFSKRARRIEGLEQGRAAVTGKTSELVEGVSRTADPQILGAQRQGLRAELSDVALGGPQGAAKVHKSLAEDTGLQDRLHAILPEKQAQALIEIGEIGDVSRLSLNELTPTVRKQADAALGNLTDAILVASPQIPASASALAVGRLLKHKGLGIDRRVATNMINDLYDPAKSAEVIDLMLSRGLSHADVAELLVVGLSGSSAINQATE